MQKLQANPINLESSSYWYYTGNYDFVDKWFLMSSPYPILAITAIYLLFVLKLGPEYMKNRKPFQLTNVLVVYNAVQVAISMIMVYWAIQLLNELGLFPQTCVPENRDALIRMTSTGYLYFICKITELLDTIFFVLRKKQNQVSFLHVYHHTMMVLNGWFYTKYEPGAWMVLLGFLNCLVHVTMYGYYGLSAYPSLKKYLWWKKYITSLQLLQFALVLLHLTISLFICECKPATYTLISFYTNVCLFIYLFSSFYYKAYSKTNKRNDNEINNKELSHLNGNNGHVKKNLSKKIKNDNGRLDNSLNNVKKCD